jgi:phospho-N-acetylmuramoyl-pentapeptide-transferase
VLNFLIADNLWLKAFICLIGSFSFSYFSIKKYIEFAHQNPKFFQPIRSDGPQTHIKNKQKTPTMGGLFIVLSTILSVILFTKFTNQYILISLLVFTSFAAIGFIDDLMKIFCNNCHGFKGGYKIIIQFLIIGLSFLWLGCINDIHFQTKIFFAIGDGYYLFLGTILYVLFVNIVIVGSANAVNLTDGLDGLVSIPAIITLSSLIILIHASSNLELSENFNVSFVKFSGELIFLCICLIGSIFGFLKHNLKPAKIFMGDVGSLAIGSLLGLIAIIIKQEFIFFIIALLFVFEALSVILQVTSYKIRRKRIFLMAPLHHHFEKKGWSEEKVVKNFWLMSLLFAATGLGIFLL